MWPLSVAICNLEQLSIEGYRLAVPDSFMNAVSVHGGLELVILEVASLSKHVIAALIENSPNLIACHIHVEVKNIYHNLRHFRSRLKKKYSHQKLFIRGSYHLKKGEIPQAEIRAWYIYGSMELLSLWNYSDKVEAT